jgi:hypothetical protein
MMDAIVEAEVEAQKAVVVVRKEDLLQIKKATLVKDQVQKVVVRREILQMKHL